MNFSKSQIYSLISQRVEQLQKTWYADLNPDVLVGAFDTDLSLQNKRKEAISQTVDQLLSELDQEIDPVLAEHWKRHFIYSIYPTNNTFKQSLLHFFNPIMINALGFNVLGQAFMLTLLSQDDKKDQNFAYKQAQWFMNHINLMLDKPYEQHTLNLFIHSIHVNYINNFVELSASHRSANNPIMTYYYVHRKRFDLPSLETDVHHPFYLYATFINNSIATDNPDHSLINRFPEILENTVTLRNALFSMLFADADYLIEVMGSEIQALPFGRSGLLIDEVLDTFVVTPEHNLTMCLMNSELTHEDLVERIGEHFSFMHDYLICETLVMTVAQDLFDKKIFGRIVAVFEDVAGKYDLKKLFKDSYNYYTDKRFINTKDVFEDIKLS